jgi:hypothetical protein
VREVQAKSAERGVTESQRSERDGTEGREKKTGLISGLVPGTGTRTGISLARFSGCLYLNRKHTGD